MTNSLALVVLLLCVLLTEVQSADFISGGEARRVCEAYKLICPVKKVCALQSIGWPRAMKFPVCVHSHHLVVKSKICRRAPAPGKCGARFVRWYFNVHMGACSWFTYSGCGGNKNNFRTAEECERRCTPTQGDTTRRLTPRNLTNSLVPPGYDDEKDERQPTLISAPLKAAETIDINTDENASLIASRKAAEKALRRERRKRNQERRERRWRRKQKIKTRKNRKNQTVVSERERTEELPSRQPPRRELTPLELGPNYSSEQSFAELTGRRTTHKRFGHAQKDQAPRWVIDSRFRRRRRKQMRTKRRQLPHDFNEATPRDTNTNKLDIPRAGHSGSRQDTYYDHMKLFNILQKQRTNSPVV